MSPELTPLTLTSEPSKSSHSRTITIALAGNANVGKSAIFNQLTGLEQETGNWSGKTVALKEGRLAHHGLDIRIVDLPGVYSFSSYSPDELMTRQFILNNRPDIIINVLDATSMERNLYLTLLLKELEIPCVIALNYADVARKKHLHLDLEKLSQILGFPVINTVAIKGIGVHELTDAAINIIQSKVPIKLPVIHYGPEVEERVKKLSQALTDSGIQTPARWTALKLLEKDLEISSEVKRQAPATVVLAALLLPRNWPQFIRKTVPRLSPRKDMPPRPKSHAKLAPNRNPPRRSIRSWMISLCTRSSDM